MSNVLTGAGMHYGADNGHGRANIYSMAQWDRTCAQAASWGMSYVHPKVAELYEGNPYWYSEQDLHTMKRIAENHHLKCIPYQWLWGNARGHITLEAQVFAYLGSIFGAVIADIESPWDRQRQWAIDFGRMVRHDHGYRGLALATVFANPATHPTPISELNDWVDGFMPQVYFAVWRPQTAEFALNYIKPQWAAIANDIWHHKEQRLKPLSPIIEVGTDNVPVSEIEEWIRLNGRDSDYCGFWYDRFYAPYAGAVKALIPHYLSSAVVAPTQSPPQHHPIPSPQQEGGLSDMALAAQKLTDEQLSFLYKKNDTKIVFDRRRGICNLWCEIVTDSPEIAIGSPKFDEQIVQILNGAEIRKYAMIEFESGRRIYWDIKDRVLALV